MSIFLDYDPIKADKFWKDKALHRDELHFGALHLTMDNVEYEAPPSEFCFDENWNVQHSTDLTRQYNESEEEF